MRNFLHSLSLGIALIGFVSCGMNQEQVEQLMTENKILKKENETLQQEVAELKNTLQPIIEQQEKEKKSSKGLIFNDQISIKRIEAGYNPHNSEGIWVPCVAIMFKNISNRDIAQYIKITVIFINNTKEEQMDTDYQYLATSSRIFISGTTKQLSFSSSTGWYGATRGLDVTARIYVDDELVLTKKIPTGEFDGMIR